MSIAKVVQLTPGERDELRNLVSNAESSARALTVFKSNLSDKYKPTPRQYGPFYVYSMQVLDDKGDDTTISDLGATHLVFTQSLQ